MSTRVVNPARRVVYLSVMLAACATAKAPAPPPAAPATGAPSAKENAELLELLKHARIERAIGYGAVGVVGGPVVSPRGTKPRPTIAIDHAGRVRVDDSALKPESVEERIRALLSTKRTDELAVISSIMPIPPGLRQAFERAGARQIVTYPAKELIWKAIEDRHSDVTDCYRAARAKTPSLAGRVAVQFHIAPDGHVTHSALQPESTLAGEAATCVVAAVRRWSFPKADGMTTVFYTFRLEPPR